METTMLAKSVENLESSYHTASSGYDESQVVTFWYQ
jgi:hypothetical protein